VSHSGVVSTRTDSSSQIAIIASARSPHVLMNNKGNLLTFLARERRYLFIGQKRRVPFFGFVQWSPT
jgi:hypothetical protein